jgi:chromosome segregation ATPase
MDAQTIAALSGLLAALGTALTGWLGYRARQAEQRYGVQLKKLETSSQAETVIVVNERLEAAKIREEQRGEIAGLRRELTRRDERIDQLQDRVRKADSRIERLEAQVEQLQRENERLRQERHPS